MPFTQYSSTVRNPVLYFRCYHVTSQVGNNQRARSVTEASRWHCWTALLLLCTTV
jgi:hypothetical protein